MRLLVWSTLGIDTTDTPNNAYTTLGLYGPGVGRFRARPSSRDHLGDAGNEGDWELIDSVSPVMTEGRAGSGFGIWPASLRRRASWPRSRSRWRSIILPPRCAPSTCTTRAAWSLRARMCSWRSPRTRCTSERAFGTTSSRCTRSAPMKWRRLALPVVLQFGETQWWYFDNRAQDAQGGMPVL